MKSGQILFISTRYISMPFCIGLTFISFIFLDDYDSSSLVLVLRLNVKLKIKKVRFLSN